jgi:hypothetical protein
LSSELRAAHSKVKSLTESRGYTAAIFAADEAVNLDRLCAESFYLRARLFLQLGDFLDAGVDINRLLELSPHDPRNILLQAEWAYASDQDAILAQTCKQGLKWGFDFFVYYLKYLIKCNGAVDVDEGVLNRIRVIDDLELRELRVQLNAMLGNYQNALNDVGKLRLFTFPMRGLLPPVYGKLAMEEDGRCVSILLRAFVTTFDRPISDVAFDLGIERRLQLAWTQSMYMRPDVLSFLDKVAPPVQTEIDQRVFPLSLVNVAIDFGRLVNSITKNKRRLACLGFAFIELVQMLTDAVAPGFFKALAIPANWMRLADPVSPIFLRAAGEQPAVWIRKNGLPTNLAGYTDAAFAILRNGLVADGLTYFALTESPEDVFKVQPISAVVQVPGSPASIFLKPSYFGHPDFGICLPDLGTCEESLRAWALIFLDRENALVHALGFLFAWLRERPLAGCSPEIGVCIFLSVLNAVIGVDVMEGFPPIIDIELMAWLSPSLESFAERFKKRASMTIAAGSRVTHLPMIEEGLPNMHLRCLALMAIKEDDFGFRY